MNRDSATTAMRKGDFTSGHQVGNDYVRVPKGTMARGAMRANPGLAPRNEALQGHRGSARSVPPCNVAERHVIARHDGLGRPGVSASRASGAGRPAASPIHSGSTVGEQRGLANHGARPEVHTASNRGFVPGRTTNSPATANHTGPTLSRPAASAGHVNTPTNNHTAPGGTVSSAASKPTLGSPHAATSRPPSSTAKPATTANRAVPAINHGVAPASSFRGGSSGQPRPTLASASGRAAVGAPQAMARNMRPANTGSASAHNIGARR